MKNLTVVLGILAAALFSSNVLAQDGLVSVKSANDVNTTADRLEAVLSEKGMKVFARIDHAAGAQSIGDTLAPMELVIFGNPKVGTGLMKCAGSMGIDLPMKALIWQDGEGATWFGYNDMSYLATRHGATDCGPLVEKVSGALAAFAKAATTQ